MKRFVACGMALLAVYLASGFYIVRGNEKAVVCRFGRADRALITGGLHYDLPWPFVRIERINVHELRTLTIGIAATETLDGTGFFQNMNLDRQGEFLTGDKNILSMQVNVHYLIADPHPYLFDCQSPEAGLRLLAESLVAEKVAQCSVDFVHPLGRSELQVILTQAVRQAIEDHPADYPWGIAVDNITLASVVPPVEVKAAFLDVSNARAERDRLISHEESRGEKLLAAAVAAVQQIRDRADATHLARIESARGAADRFSRVIAQFQSEAKSGGPPAHDVRRATMQRLLAEALEEILPRLARQVLLDSTRPLDLTIFPPHEKPKPDAELQPGLGDDPASRLRAN